MATRADDVVTPHDEALLRLWWAVSPERRRYLLELVAEAGELCADAVAGDEDLDSAIWFASGLLTRALGELCRHGMAPAATAS